MLTEALARTGWHETPRAVRYGVVIVLYLAAAWAGARFLLQPQSRVRGELRLEVNRLEAENEALRLQVMEASRRVGKEEDARRSLDVAAVRLQAALDRLPDSRSLSSFLRELTRPERARGVDFQSITPRPMENRGEFLELPFTIEMEAAYASLGRYLAGIEELDRLVIVRNIALRARPEETLLKVSISAATFVMGGEQ